MSILGLLCLLFALIAALILVLYGLQRRELRSIGQLSEQLLRIAAGGPIPERLDLGSDKAEIAGQDRKSTRLNSSHSQISYAVFCLKKKKKTYRTERVSSTQTARWLRLATL